tara:strand:- start:4342 stop:5157 length:816 start_codon:yes stop_codon:yes gene_type:complete
MKKLLIILFAFTGSFINAQGYDFQQLCVDCANADGYYCGDDPANWTQYAPMGCVQNSWINDEWEDCVDASDENGAVPTTLEDCAPPVEECDTVYVEIPVIEYEYIYETDTITETEYITDTVEVEVPFYIYETIIQLDTIIQTEYITQIVVDTFEVEVMVPEYIYVTDTLWMDGALDTMYVDVIEYVEVIVIDTVVETEYVEIFVVDTVVEYIEVINTEYVDCDTGMPCNSGMEEIINKSIDTGLLYDLTGRVIRKPEGIYIEGGKIKYLLK